MLTNVTLNPSPRCLNDLLDHIKNNLESYQYGSEGSIDNDNPDFVDIWNVPRNYSSIDPNDTFTYDFEIMVQNNTNGIIKLMSVYNEGDFIGWHTNSAVNGYNLILTYSENDQSYFETLEGKLYDEPNVWTYKVNEFNDEPFWHRAEAKGFRLVISILFESEQDLQHGLSVIQSL